MARESWWVINNTKRPVVIGDLPRVPTIESGKKVDLLLYATKDQIGQSQNLTDLSKSGAITIKKYAGITQKTISRNRSEESITSVEEEELTDALTDALTDYYTKDEVYTKDETDDLLVAAHNRLIVSVEPKSGQYDSIAAAIAAVTSPADDNRWVIKVEPGIYTEPLCDIPSYVSIVGDSTEAVVVKPDGDHNIFNLSQHSRMNFMTISDAPSGRYGIYAYDIGNFAILHKVSITDCETGVYLASNTADSYLFLEYVDFTDCDTVAKVTNLASKTAFLNGENIYFEYMTKTPVTAVTVDGAYAQISIQGLNALSASGSGDGTAFLVTNGGYLNVSSGRAEDWNIAFRADTNGSNPYIKIQSVDIDDCTTNLKIENTTAEGYFAGFTEVEKTEIAAASGFFIVSNDSNIITVAKKGGEYTSVKEAIDNITNASVTNKYIILIGPGVFKEDTIVMKDYIYLLGCLKYASHIELDTATYPASTHLITANDKKSSISDCILEANGKTVIRYTGGSFRVLGCQFYDCTTCIDATNISGTTTNKIILNDTDLGIGQTATTFITASDDGAHTGVISLNNVKITDGTLTDFALVVGSNTTLKITNSKLDQDTLAGTCISMSNGSNLEIIASTISGFATGFDCPNVGSGPDIKISALWDSNTEDIDIENPLTTGTIVGIATATKIKVTDLADVSLSITDPNDGSLNVVGDYYRGDTWNDLTNFTPLLNKGQALGAIYGGELDTGSGDGLYINISSGNGYLMTGDSPDDHATFIEWDDTALLLPASTSSYIYVDDDEHVHSADTLPDFFKTIILGKVQTSATGILFIQDIIVEANQMVSRLDRTLRSGFGPIYSSGSQLAETGIRELNITQGKYYYGTHEYTPPEENTIGWTAWYYNGSSWVTVAQKQVDKDNYNNLASGLSALGAGNYTKHAFYLANDNTTGHTTYQLVYGSSNEADPANTELPNPPGFWTSNIVRVQSILVRQSSATIIEFEDLTPKLSFVAPATTTITQHALLGGLATGNDHPQYLRRDGTSTMVDNLDVGGNDIVGVGLVDGIDVGDHSSRHNPNSGTDPLSTSSAVSIGIGTTNTEGNDPSFARNDHTHLIENAPVSAGAYGTDPTFVDNGNGTANIGAGDYLLYTTTDFTGPLTKYSIAALSNAAFTEGVTSYVVVNYNGGSPEYQVITNVELITESSILPVFTVFRHGTTLHYIDWDRMADGMVNKIHQRMVKTDRTARESGLALSESGTRVVEISEGKFWYGGVRTTAAAFSSDTDMWHFWKHVATVWTIDLTTTAYNNSQYDNGTNLVNLTADYFTVNWVYRGIESTAHAHYILGDAEYASISAAIESQPPASLPPMISSSAFLVGRIIIKQGQNTASGTTGKIESAFTVKFVPVPINSHNELYSLQGGTAAEYYHLTNAQHTGLTSFTGDRAIVSNAGGTTLSSSAVTATELGYVSGVTSSIQTQLGTKTTAVSPSVADNFVSFSNITGGQKDSGKKDTDYVHVIGNENIAGIKTFTNSISVTQNQFFPVVSLSLTAGGANDDVVIGNGTFFRVTLVGTGNFTVSGFAGGADGRRIIVFYPNTTGDRMTIVNDATSVAANRIYTCTSGNILTAAGTGSRGIFEFIYSGTDSRWILISYIQ